MQFRIEEGPNPGQYVVLFDFEANGEEFTFFVPLLSAAPDDVSAIRNALETATQAIARASFPPPN